MNDERHIRAVRFGGESVEKGQIYSVEFSIDSEILSWVDRNSQSSNEHILLFSRLPHRRLLEHVDLQAVEAYWLSERVTKGAVQPELTEVDRIIQQHLSNHSGIIVVEGLEWLVTKHGEDSVLSFIRRLRESVHRTQWTILIPVRPLAFESLWLARMRREAPPTTLDFGQDDNTEIIEEVNIEGALVENETLTPTLEIREDGSPRLVMLTRLPSLGFTQSLLRKRILQWRRMGLDVSGVEPALTMEEDASYRLYTKIEELVRRAVDLDHAIDSLIPPLSASQEAVARFRIRQLTGLDELEKAFFEDTV